MALCKSLYFALLGRLVRTIGISHGFQDTLSTKKGRLIITMKQLEVVADGSAFGIMCDLWLQRSSIAIPGIQGRLLRKFCRHVVPGEGQ